MGNRKLKRVTVKTQGANSYPAKTRIFEVIERNVEMVVIQRLVLADLKDKYHFNNYDTIKTFKNKKLLKQ